MTRAWAVFFAVAFGLASIKDKLPIIDIIGILASAAFTALAVAHD